MVTTLYYTHDPNFAYLSSAEAEKSYRTGGWWLGFEFRDSSSLGLSWSINQGANPTFQNANPIIKKIYCCPMSTISYFISYQNKLVQGQAQSSIKLMLVNI